MKIIISLIGIYMLVLLVGCSKSRYLGELEPMKIPPKGEPEDYCDLIQIWNESENCIYDYCEEKCWTPYGLKFYTVDESKYDFDNDSKINPYERFILDQNLKTAVECNYVCYKNPYGCFDYVIDIRCKTNKAVDKINTTSGQIIKWSK